ncbi:MAG TPA: DUF2071 domain-containing protein [Oligoflexia bacterium]|nr:DUF2071 domain-containing protein [Oligoflexia bacterium]HMR24427.1 DUF2071 domain-containing protein [Oligoflexia bacterium]
MNIPSIKGVIERRILINYKLDPIVAKKLLPTPFEPIVLNNFASVGICLIRLNGIKPTFLPDCFAGIRSENAAHRFAVRYPTKNGYRDGVYIPRRDTSSKLNAMAGGCLFPGIHHLSNFKVIESQNHYYVSFKNKKDGTFLEIDCTTTQSFPKQSMFNSFEQASEFFRNGSCGFSPTDKKETFQGLTLKTYVWEMYTLSVNQVVSSYFNNTQQFPKNSIEFDNALLMKNIPHHWITEPSLNV